MGDYLDVGGRSAQGELLRNAAGISGEYCLFMFAHELDRLRQYQMQLRRLFTLAQELRSWFPNSVERVNSVLGSSLW